jgi:amino acid transporter
LIISTWVVWIFTGVGSFLLTFFKFDYVRKEAKISKIMSVYVLSSLYAIFSVFVITSYILIFIKYTFFQKRLHNSQEVGRKRIPTDQQRRSPRFTLCALLATTYVLLTVLPSLTRAGLYMAEVKFPYAITFWYLISIRISYTVDGVLYVLMQKKVKRWLSRKLCCCCYGCHGNSVVRNNIVIPLGVVANEAAIQHE